MQKTFEEIILLNPILKSILEKASLLNLPSWYLGAGCISQTIWNYKSGLDLNYGIGDYDLVYFDSDISKEKEDLNIQKAKEVFGEIPVEVVNEARVHTWFESHFDYKMDPYLSTEQAIDTWPTTATAIGVRFENNELKIYAPYGIEDAMNLIVRANKKTITREVYEKKVQKWTSLWPNLKIIPWE